ncbi:hypothetical protein GCM10012275_15000 [Longimycelium tulufanense]|uniref:Uncharacterized protein n=1 Tax=Longimycelium tulufanense TaxID=907463 RepID=A0A8J3C9C7_9PSEU|nr:hypothetical protein [Longimycelium tulufanense]GGM44972.1 hypothetical protein GCM10012275_15000 [Longimycelium tulufanense]
MHRRLPLTVALPTAALLTALSAPPAAATPPTTPIPFPVDPGAPPDSAPRPPYSRPVVADAGSGLALVRLLPRSVETKTSLPGQSEHLPRQSAGEVGLGLATAQANSEAHLTYESAIAESAPLGFAVRGRAPRPPGSLTQTALPDNDKPLTRGHQLPEPPADALARAGVGEGSVHARWDQFLGACVDPIADARTSLASLSAVNVIPSLPANPDLAGLLPESAPSMPPEATKALIDGVQALSAPLHQLGGLLSGQGKADGSGSLVHAPGTLGVRSTVRLVDVEGLPGKAVRATSTVEVSSVRLLPGTPQEIRAEVVSQPTLTATSTGEENTSTLHYAAPVVRVVQTGQELAVLDAANPKLDVPVGVPIFTDDEPLQRPVIGALLPDGSPVPSALGRIDIAVLRLHIGQLSEKRTGASVGAVARLLDVQLVPTNALNLPDLPPALAQVAIGEQVARALAPRGGVTCGAPEQPAAPQPVPPQAAPTPPLAHTNAAYDAIPLLWLGAGLLLTGAILVSALPSPTRRRRSEAGTDG